MAAVGSGRARANAAERQGPVGYGGGGVGGAEAGVAEARFADTGAGAGHASRGAGDEGVHQCDGDQT